jgi:hypothetical protein
MMFTETVPVKLIEMKEEISCVVIRITADTLSRIVTNCHHHLQMALDTTRHILNIFSIDTLFFQAYCSY